MLKKKCSLVLAILMLVLSMVNVSAFATSSVGTETVSPIGNTGNAKASTSTNTYTTGEYDTGLPEVTLDEFEEKVESKFYKVIKLLQTGAKPVCIIFFIFGALLAVVGLMGKGGVWKGLLVMGMAALMYTAIMYAPEIVQFIQAWTVA